MMANAFAYIVCVPLIILEHTLATQILNQCGLVNYTLFAFLKAVDQNPLCDFLKKS